MKQFSRKALLMGLAIISLITTGCSTPQPVLSAVEIPKSYMDEPIPDRQQNGTIYSANRNLSLFEDKKPIRLGDQVVVTINERTNAQKSAKSSASRETDLKNQVPQITGIPGQGPLLGFGINAKNSDKFTGGGDTTQNNVFTGTITSTVVRVLSNGNFVIKGHKQVALNGDLETLTFEGIVHPDAVGPGRVVSSLNVAEARISYNSKGDIGQAQNLGIFSKIFMSLAPF